MYHCPSRSKGILDKKYVPKYVVFRKIMSYESVLQKCVASVYPGTAADCNSDFYVANSCGLPICCENNIAIDRDQGEEEFIPWSLGVYIKLSNVQCFLL